MPGGLLLDPLTAPVQGVAGELDDVERVPHRHGVGGFSSVVAVVNPVKPSIATTSTPARQEAVRGPRRRAGAGAGAGAGARRSGSPARRGTSRFRRLGWRTSRGTRRGRGCGAVTWPGAVVQRSVARTLPRREGLLDRPHAQQVPPSGGAHEVDRVGVLWLFLVPSGSGAPSRNPATPTTRTPVAPEIAATMQFVRATAARPQARPTGPLAPAHAGLTTRRHQLLRSRRFSRDLR